MLIGSYRHTIDGKGRLFIPAKWRTDLGETIIVTRGIENCLVGMCLEEWERIAVKLKAIPLTNRDAQHFVRYISQWASDCETDKQGRILLPPSLRTFANVGNDVTLIGMQNRIEIWDSETLQRHQEQNEATYDQMLEKISTFEI